jgi:hypothetical protein
MRLALVLAAVLVSFPLQAASPVLIDATGRILGFYAEVRDSTPVVVSPQGYLVRYDLRNARVSSEYTDLLGGGTSLGGALYYSVPNCAGDPYVSYPQLSAGGFVFSLGSFEPTLPRADLLFYVPKGLTQEVQFTTASRLLLDGTCQNGNTATGPFLRVYPNDPNETGVPGQPAGPLRLEVGAIDDPSGLLLRDGFESTELSRTEVQRALA